MTETLQTPVRELTTGSTFAGRYQIIEELGHGGMGRVYKVLDTDIKEKIALKLLRPEIALDKETVERFSNELKLARKIRHKNICGMFDLGKAEGTTFITMEFVPGEDLKKLIRKTGQLGAGRAISIAKQVSEGLAEAHRLGVIHRDLKSQNIMVDEDGNARIMDFGIARSLSGKGITGAGVMIGTPEYMSPEQVEGEEVDKRSDIYSLGVILFEMVTGRVPFEGDTPFTIGVKQKSERPRNPRELNAQLPEDLSRLILRCLEKDKSKRYQTAEELHADLERVEAGLPTTERIVAKRRPITSKEITVMFQLNKILVPAFAGIIILVAALVFIPGLFHKRLPASASGRPLVAIMTIKNNTGDQNNDDLAGMLIDDLSQGTFLEVVPFDKLYGVLGRLHLLTKRDFADADLKNVAALTGATHILTGLLNKSGDRFRINAILQETATGKDVASPSAEGEVGKGIFPLVDELKAKVKDYFGSATRQAVESTDKNIQEITTTSPEAYRYYSEARKLHSNGDYAESIVVMQKALALDPTFAMAYRSLAMSYGNLGFLSEKLRCLQKAVEFSGRLPDKERLYIQANLYECSERTYDKALAIYKKLLADYPVDPLAANWCNAYGVVYDDLEEYDKAAEQFEAARRLDPESFLSAYNLWEVYCSLGDYNKAQRVIEDRQLRVGDTAMGHLGLAGALILQGKFDLGMAEFDKVIVMAPGLYQGYLGRGQLRLIQGNFAEAEMDFQKLLDINDADSQLAGREELGYLFLARGKFALAKQYLNKAIQLAAQNHREGSECGDKLALGFLLLESGVPSDALREFRTVEKEAQAIESYGCERRVILGQGLASLALRSLTDAEKAAADLEKLNDSGMNRKAYRYGSFLSGSIEFAKRNYPQAIRHFQDAIGQLSSEMASGAEHAWFRDALALAYWKAADLQKARDIYIQITALNFGRIHAGEIYARSYYRLGLIYEKLGDKGQARESYNKFLDLWKDADPGLPEVPDAKARLAALMGS
jgi:serine/threonine protein kinase/tetratricopeptide (TPR) repeat protein